MAYKEKYPLDITPQGDTVQDSIKKNRDELLNVAQQMELKASGGGGANRNVQFKINVQKGAISLRQLDYTYEEV